MAELKLPWYKCTPAKFLAGNIMLCELEEIGLFSIIEKIYWSRECSMTKSDLIRRIKRYPDHERILGTLITEGIIKQNCDDIIIDYLLHQWDEQSAVKKKLSESGRKGADIANSKRKAASPQLPLEVADNEDVHSEKPKPGHKFWIGKGINRKSVTVPVSEYINENMKIFCETFMMTMKHVKMPAVLKVMDSESEHGEFADEAHIRNTFKIKARILNAQNTTTNIKNSAHSTKRTAPNTED